MSSGVFLIGWFAGVEPVRYGRKQGDRGGQPVAGLYVILIRLTEDANAFPVRASFSDVDRVTGEPSRLPERLAELGLVEGEPVRVRVTPRAGTNGYVNYDARWIEREDGNAEAA